MNITIQQSEISLDGRFIVLKADINNETYTIANVYGPNKDTDAVKFYRNLSKLLRNDDFANEDNIFSGRDCNCPLDISLDKKGGLPIPGKYVTNSVAELQNEFSLHDIWRLKNPTLQSFTWEGCSPFIFCRLDYWLISRAIIRQRGTLPVRPLGYLNFKKVIFRTMRTMRKQFPVTQLTSDEVVQFRETRFHPK